jgi:hypothetical protein
MDGRKTSGMGVPECLPFPLHMSSETLYRPHYHVSTGALKSGPASKAEKHPTY